MKNRTIALPELYIQEIDKLIGKKEWRLRSDWIRTAICEFLAEEMPFFCALKLNDPELAKYASPRQLWVKGIIKAEEEVP